MSSETSVLTEVIPENLLDERDIFTIVVKDAVGEEVSRYETSRLPENLYKEDFSGIVPTGPEGPILLEDFIELLSQVISQTQDNQGILESEKVKLVADFNPDRVHEHGDEVITYKIIERKPANMNAKGTGRPQRAFNFNYDAYNPKHPNKVIIVAARPIDHMIELSAWSHSATLANKRALWLERTLISNAWVFRVKGADRFHWEGRGSDTFWNVGGAALHQRPIRFRVRLQEYFAEARQQIKRFNLNLSAN